MQDDEGPEMDPENDTNNQLSSAYQTDEFLFYELVEASI